MQHRHSELRTCQLPPAHSILKRVFNTPEKVKELALACGVKTTHVHKWLRGGESSAPSDLDRLCKVIFLAATFGEEGISGAGLIADYVREYFLTIVEQSATPYADEQDRVSDSSELLREATDAVNALVSGAICRNPQRIGQAARQGRRGHQPPERHADGGAEMSAQPQPKSTPQARAIFGLAKERGLDEADCAPSSRGDESCRAGR